MQSTFLRAALACAIALTFAGGAATAQDKPVSLRMASNAPPTSPWAMQINRFAKAVDAESKGTVKIEPFFGGQLGNEQDTIQQVARGRIDMGFFAAGAVALLLPEAQMSILPFYYASPVQADCVLDNHLGKPLAELLSKKGVELVGFGSVGNIDLVGKKPYVSPQDVAGTKAVAYSKMQSMMWSALRANSSFIGVPDWSSSLQTGLADNVGAPMALYVPSGLNKIVPVLTRLELWESPAFLLVNKGTFEKMSQEQRAAVQRAFAQDPAAKMRGEIRAMESSLRAAHQKGGGTIVEITPEQREEWRKVIAPVWPQMAKELGGDSERLFQVAEAARKTCPAK